MAAADEQRGGRRTGRAGRVTSGPSTQWPMRCTHATASVVPVPCLACASCVRRPARSVSRSRGACRVAELVSCTRIRAACCMPACAAQLGNRLLESDVIRSIEPQHRFKNSTKAPLPTPYGPVSSPRPQRLHNAATLPVVRCPSCGASYRAASAGAVVRRSWVARGAAWAALLRLAGVDVCSAHCGHTDTHRCCTGSRRTWMGTCRRRSRLRRREWRRRQTRRSR